MKDILYKIVLNEPVHARWLNTLSYMENAGARKISECEHPETVDITQLKHAAEEHRHAYYLKKQIQKLNFNACEHYHSFELLAPLHTKQYLQNLDIKCSRYLKDQFGLLGKDLKYASYLFVTYAIEIRADLLYPIYQEVLTEQQSRITVKSIILEEEGHLEEMTAMLERFDQNWEQHASHMMGIENSLFDEWFSVISREVLANESVRGTLV
ncbi:rubrerythrin [Algoriphagus sp. 4150]|uniref:hypothetical protein n=1 Tax=Algoriphagus sp. 4150 TaxID=2817756 RepID=UPI00285E176D|nr:hypothetical protein [Algoriphagus sp. 4150]MDR7130198.1 rubrerythrin [Algoriphagus sp. 4150]